MPRAPTGTPPAGTGGPPTGTPSLSDRLNTLLDSDSPYIERARYRGRQAANRRGLLNSSIAAGAAEAAALDAALPIAQGDIASIERALDRDLSQLLQKRDNDVRMLMQQRGFTFEQAQREADRNLQRLLADRAREHSRQLADLDRNRLLGNTLAAIDADLARQLTLIAQNPNIPAEERRRLEEELRGRHRMTIDAVTTLNRMRVEWDD